MSLECYIPNFQLIVAKSEVCFKKIGGTLKLIEKIIYPSKRILILDGNLFQLTVIYTNPKGTIFLPNKQDQSTPR